MYDPLGAPPMALAGLRMDHEFTVYAVGLCYASVCTSLAVDDVERWLNIELPTGVTPWRLAAEGFRSGEPNGMPCPDQADRRHFLFSC